MKKLAWLVPVTFWCVSGVAAAQEDSASRSDAICCGASCCLIDGNCHSNGDTNPSNSCEVCDPARSQTAWSSVSGCGGTDAGGGGGGAEDDGGGCSAAGGAGGGSLLGIAALWWLRRRRIV